MAKILCVDDDADLRAVLVRTLTRAGHEVRGVASAVEALQALAREPSDLVVSDWSMPGLTGLDLLQLLREEGHETPVVILTAYGSIDHAVAAIKAGAVNYLVKPFEAAQIHLAVAQALEVARLRTEHAALLRESAAWRRDHDIVGESPAIRRVLDAVTAAASSRATVLLQGESGTGKELLARAIHDQSERRHGPFVQINCAALPESLIESTLFGHEKGAFTGAFKWSLGAFERADGGTLLLDEVSEMRLDLQPKLLRVLQERRFERLGGSHPIQVEVRIVATTNRDLAAHVAAGHFREDLYYRLSVFPVHVPPLRERREDVPSLAYPCAARAAAEVRKPFEGIAPEALDLLLAHEWPGNVRELQHAIERAVIVSHEATLQPHHFTLHPARRPPWMTAAGSLATAAPRGEELAGLHLTTLDLRTVEARVIAHALQITAGNRSRAAELLGIDVRTLRRKLNDRGAQDDASGPALFNLG